MIPKNLIVLASVLCIFICTGCLNIEYQNTPKIFEIMETDVFSIIEDIDSTQVSVKGVKLNDSFDDIILSLGNPDIQTQVGPNSFNLEYREKFMVEYVALLFHTENGIITRITFRPPFNAFLKGKTVIGTQSKKDIYNLFGKPDRMELASFFTIYYFNEKGFEIIIDKDKMAGFSLVMPTESTRNEKVIVN